MFDAIEEVALCDALTFTEETLGKYDQEIPLDILIILDHSNKIKQESILFVQECMADFVKEFKDVGDGENAVKFALTTYNSKITIEMLFNDTASSTRVGTLAAIDNMSIKRGKNRRTDRALENANSIVFTPKGGDRPFARNVVVLVTGGMTTKAKHQKNTFRAADALKAREGAEAVAIYLLWIPVKRPEKLTVIQKEWKEIPSEPKSKHLKDFNELSPLMLFERFVEDDYE